MPGQQDGSMKTSAAREKNLKRRKKFIIYYENDCFRFGYYIAV